MSCVDGGGCGGDPVGKSLEGDVTHLCPFRNGGVSPIVVKKLVFAKDYHKNDAFL